MSEKKFPITHVLGFFLSIALTFFAVWIALKTGLAFSTIKWLIGGLAVVQAMLQLFMFMHMNEGEDGKTQTINILYAFILATIIVGGSVWVMASGHSHL